MQLRVSTTDGKSADIAVHPGDSLARAIYLSGAVAPRPLCSGLGSCGLCRVRFLSAAPPALPDDQRILGAEAVDQGWRLGCKHKAADGAHVLLPDGAAGLSESGGEHPANAAAPVLLAVDLGTTSLAWSALEPSPEPAGPARIVKQGQELNPQIGAGSDVLSRLSAALSPGGEKRMQDVTLAALRRIVAELPGTVRQICLAANTAMIAITRGASVLGLAAAPYALEFQGHCEETLPGLPPIYFPSQVSAFIGADVSAGMTFLLARKPKFPFLLADLGTNGEFVLALDSEKSLAVSVPLGPALEGIGLSCGALAGVGGQTNVITSFELAPEGLRPHLACDPAAVLGARSTGAGDTVQYSGISGTGYLSLVHILRKLGLVCEDGRFAKGDASGSGLSPLAKNLVKRLHSRNGQLEFELPGGLSLTGTDLEEILKVKAAFSLALYSLLRAAGLAPAGLRGCYLAGALGRHVCVDDLFGLGFLPAALKAEKVSAVGNTALAGAEQMLADLSARALAAQWATRVKVLNLAVDNTFMRLYLEHMRFAFPSSNYV